MTVMAILWQSNCGFRPIGALFFEINGIFHYTLSIFIEISKKYTKLFVTLISNLFKNNLQITNIVNLKSEISIKTNTIKTPLFFKYILLFKNILSTNCTVYAMASSTSG